MDTGQPIQVLPCEAQKGSPPRLKFSLVLATLGRTAELSNFLSYLDRQSFRNFELIVIDQNPDDRLIPVLAPYGSRFEIKHLRSEKGLSRARNLGLRHISGDVVAFPDDDCWYPPETLETVARTLASHPEWDGITGKWNSRHQTGAFLSRFNVWLRTCSILIFLRASVVKVVGEFDEMLGSGSGSGFGGAEETDYLLRALERNFRIYHEPELKIEHPDPVAGYNEQSIEKACCYARGVGYVFRKHRFPAWYLGYFLLRHLSGAALAVASCNLPKARFYWAMFRGRLSGWLEGKTSWPTGRTETLSLDRADIKSRVANDLHCR